MEKGEGALSPKEGKLLELLGILIEDYDDRRYPGFDWSHSDIAPTNMEPVWIMTGEV